MRATLWGTRGSFPTPGIEYARYGGNTTCVEIRAQDRWVTVLDAGTGARPLGATIGPDTQRVDLLLSHLHMDHIQALGFFAPLFTEGLDVHVWGPASTTLDIHERLGRYLSPPLFPVRLRELPCELTLHNTPLERFEIGDLSLTADLICHPGPTLGYRITHNERTLVYMPDHELALGFRGFALEKDWTSGFAVAEGADVLIHDTQYTDDEYAEHVGWGHSAVSHTLLFAEATCVKRLVTMHHDPSHNDDALDAIHADARERAHGFEVVAGVEGLSFEV